MIKIILLFLLVFTFIFTFIFTFTYSENYKENFELGKTKEGIVCYLNSKDKGKETNFIKIGSEEIYTGLKWECVEFARRYLILTKGVTFDDVTTALDIPNLKYFRNLDGSIHPIHIFKNGNYDIKEGDLIVMEDEMDTGHVAVVCGRNENELFIAEQHYDEKEWGNKNYSRIFKVENIITSPDENEKIIAIIRT